MIVAGSFAKKEQAQKLKQRLKAAKIEARIKEEKSGTKTRYLVRVGPVTGTKEADKMERRLKGQGLTPKRQTLPARPAPAANSQGAKQ
jgi:cell division protein FtsN